ncbi:velvet factor [Circinella umbellata]|nr:velvet factor [Circinella umbellata]
MCANLAHPTDDDEIYTPNHNALSGQTVSSMYKLKDIDNNDRGFFVLGDLSVKVEGQFRLKLTLFKITLNGAVSLKSIFTDVFTVYSAKSFPGVLDSTFLSRSFSDQGARIRIRKEHRNQM